MSLTIRPITRPDAPAIERLYLQSAAYLQSLGDEDDFKFNADVYLRDGFGPNPAFAGIIGLLDDQPVGYLLYTFGYDTDAALRYLFVIDLAVDEAVRGRGIGRALMARAAEICREHGGGELFWAVYVKNERALRFYQNLGATEVDGLQFMTLRVGD